MLRNQSISALLLYQMIILCTGISNHVLLSPVLLQVAKRDSWVAALLSLIPAIAFTCLLYWTLRRTGQANIIDWLQQRFGTTIQLLVSVLASLYFLYISFYTIKDMTVWTSVSYLPKTPISAITLAFILLCFFAAKAGIRPIAISAGILLPFVVIFGLFVGITNLQFKHYPLLLPILTHGYGPTLHAALLSCGGLFEIVMILYMRHHVSTVIRLPALLFVLLILGSLTLGVLTGSISIFGPFAAADLRYPAFEQWRLVTIGKYISHLDFLSIYQWISGAFIRVSLMLFLIPELLRARTERERTIILLLFSVLLFGFSLFPLSDLTFFNQLKSWYFPVSLGMALLLTLLPLGLSWLPDKRKENRTHVKKT